MPKIYITGHKEAKECSDTIAKAIEEK